LMVEVEAEFFDDAAGDDFGDYYEWAGWLY
jgi:hypothetical protein